MTSRGHSGTFARTTHFGLTLGFNFAASCRTILIYLQDNSNIPGRAGYLNSSVFKTCVGIIEVARKIRRLLCSTTAPCTLSDALLTLNNLSNLQRR